LVDRDGYKNKFGIAVGSASAGLGRIGAQHQVDGTSLELWYLAEDGAPARAHLDAGIEPVSRLLWVNLARTASAESSVATARKGLSLVGVPDEILSDWGPEYLNRHVRRAIVRFLKIRWRKVARPYSGDLKPFIERVFRTLLHQYIELSPGYSGHSPIEASAIRKRNSFQQRRGERRNLIKLYGIKLDFEQLKELIENCVTIYNGTVHSVTGIAPAQAIAQAKAAGQLRFLSEQDEKALDMLMGAGGAAVVGKKGIRVDSMFYWSDELIPFRGRRVEYVKLRDLGNIAVYSADEPATFICIAQHPETAGLDRQVVALTAKTAERRYMKEQLGTLRRERRRFRPETIWPAIIENKAANLAARLTETPASNVVSLPYRTDAISAARAAADALDNMPARDGAVATTITGELADHATEDREARRRAKFERLSQISPANRTEDEAAWLAVYEEYGDLGPNFGRAS
jgi:putative transposase